MESATRVMVAVAAVIGAGVAAAVAVVLVLRTPPPPDDGEVALVMNIRDSGGALRKDFKVGEPIVIELTLLNGKRYPVMYEGPSCIWSPAVNDRSYRVMFSVACPGDWIRMEIPPGSSPGSGAFTWDQTCQWDCEPDKQAKQVPIGEYQVRGQLVGSVNGETPQVSDSIRVA